MATRRRTPLNRRYIRRLALLLVGVAALAAADRAGLLGTTGDDMEIYDGQSFSVTRCIDGDTLDVARRDRVRRDRHTRIRLWGVDTPETKRPNTPVQHFGPEAARFTDQAASGQQVQLQLVRRRTRDTYDRLLAYVVLPDGTMLNRELIERGLGYADPRYEHPLAAEFDKAMQRARREERGLWAEVTQADLPYYLKPAYSRD